MLHRCLIERTKESCVAPVHWCQQESSGCSLSCCVFNCCCLVEVLQRLDNYQSATLACGQPQRWHGSRQIHFPGQCNCANQQNTNRFVPAFSTSCPRGLGLSGEERRQRQQLHVSGNSLDVLFVIVTVVASVVAVAVVAVVVVEYERFF